MFSKVVEDLKSAQESLKNAPKALNEKKDALQENLTAQRVQLQEKGEALIEKARKQVAVAKNNGQERLWNLETRALETAEDLLGRADDTKLAKWTTGLEDLVTKRLDSVTVPNVEGYDSLNAKDTIKAIKTLDWLELLKVARYEQLTRNRKTVLEAVENALAGFQAEA